MSVAPGTRLGPYEIVGPLGAGGMGEVYRAKDTRLGRDVAIKLLPAHLSENAEVRDRFEREARAISSLNHPNICTLYDIGRDNDADYFVMELLEGETLAARLERGPIKLDEALKIAAQIADGLGAAHKQGIIHRDLKPSNVALTKTGAKILDFGIAKRRDEAFVDNVTRTTPLTSQGSVLGTVQYMAPEQLEGKPIDHRADFFSLGAVLYEMLTGQRAFTGGSSASVIASILREDPRPVSQLAPASPASLDRVVASCLAKDPDLRWQSAGDLARELRFLAGATGASPVSIAAPPQETAQGRAPSARLPWTLTAVAMIAAAVSIGLLASRGTAPPRKERLMRFRIEAPAGGTLTADGAQAARISPDGRTLVMMLTAPTGGLSLWTRALDSTEARPLEGTQDAVLPFWSPDSRSLGFFGNGKLTKLPIAGGPAEVICKAGDGRGASWSRQGVIVFAPEAAGPLFRVGEGGGDPVAATALDTARHETGHRWPSFLPDGQHFLYISLPPKNGLFDIFVGSTESTERKFLFAANSAPIYAEPGYLIYARNNTLVAQRFDVAKLAPMGEPVSLGEAPAPSSWTGASTVSASDDGILARYGKRFEDTLLRWLDRTGKPVGEIAAPAGRYDQFALSHDGKRLAAVRSSSVSETDIWLIDLDHPAWSRFTFGPSNNYFPAWSPDDSRIAFASDRNGPEDIFVKPTNGATQEAAVVQGGALFKEPSSWSADGKSLLFYQADPKTGWDMYIAPATPSGPPATPLLQTRFTDRLGIVSPDGRWIAYDSDESGRAEINVQSFPGLGAKYQVSNGGSFTVVTRWTRGGKELMYLGGDGVSVMAVDIAAGAAFRAGPPRLLFKLRPDYSGVDFAPDGGRVLTSSPAGPPVPPSITIDVNWTSQLAK